MERARRREYGGVGSKEYNNYHNKRCKILPAQPLPRSAPFPTAIRVQNTGRRLILLNIIKIWRDSIVERGCRFTISTENQNLVCVKVQYLFPWDISCMPTPKHEPQSLPTCLHRLPQTLTFHNIRPAEARAARLPIYLLRRRPCPALFILPGSPLNHSCPRFSN